MLKGLHLNVKAVLPVCLAMGMLLFSSCGFESVAEHESRLAGELSQAAQTSIPEEYTAPELVTQDGQSTSGQGQADSTQGANVPSHNQQTQAAPESPNVTQGTSNPPAQAGQPEQPQKPENPAAKNIQVGLSVTCKEVLGDTGLPQNIQLPPDGVLLKQTAIALKEGQSVFDALKLACAAANIELIAQSSMFGSYVQRIGPLGERDCGAQSGWKYKVNGVTPSVSSDAYQPKSGDTIEWYYATKI